MRRPRRSPHSDEPPRVRGTDAGAWWGQGWGYLRAASASANPCPARGGLTTIGSGSERVTTQTVGCSVDAAISWCTVCAGMKNEVSGPAAAMFSQTVALFQHLAVPSSYVPGVASPDRRGWCAPCSPPQVRTVLRKALSTLASGLGCQNATSRSSPGACGVSSEELVTPNDADRRLAALVISFRPWSVPAPTGRALSPATPSPNGSRSLTAGPRAVVESDVALRAAVDTPFGGGDLARQG